MGRGCFGGEGRRIPQENFHYINSILTRGGVTAHQHFQFFIGHGVLPQKRKVQNEPMGALYLISPWVNIDNQNSNGHDVRGVGVRGGENKIYYPLLPVTLNFYSGTSG